MATCRTEQWQDMGSGAASPRDRADRVQGLIPCSHLSGGRLAAQGRKPGGQERGRWMLMWALCQALRLTRGMMGATKSGGPRSPLP